MRAEEAQKELLGDEQTLIRKAKNGDQAAFTRLVKMYQRRVYTLVYRFCRDHDTADELAQETFVKAYTSLGSFREEFKFASWILTIATNLAINHLKRSKRQVSIDSEPIAAMLVDPSPSSDPVKSIIDRELMEKLESEVDKLPPDFKAVFILRVHEELSYEEIARKLGIELGTVMSRLFRARARLKKALEEYL
jgi:RNA polymerase sigma-70 factor (ECF subfamily)